MLQKTKGIVLHHVRYGDNNLIVHIYTERFGRQSYMVYGKKKRNAPQQTNLLQPLYLLDMEVSHRATHHIQQVKEYACAVTFNTLPYDIRKSSIALFLAELFYKTLREEEHNPQLFNYLYTTIQILDTIAEGTSDFLLLFLIDFTKYLGFYPHNNFTAQNQVFDMRQGAFVADIPFHPDYLSGEFSLIFSKLMQSSFSSLSFSLKIGNALRNEMIDKMLIFYRLHQAGMTELRSLPVLRQVLY